MSPLAKRFWGRAEGYSFVIPSCECAVYRLDAVIKALIRYERKRMKEDESMEKGRAAFKVREDVRRFS